MTIAATTTAMCGMLGFRTSMPCKAPSTEIAGVIIPSPYRSAEPNKPTEINSQRRFLSPSRRSVCSSNASRASTPPSPLLSARMMKEMYFSATTMISDHTIIESAPYTALSVGSNACDPEKAAWSEYSGLVPMSP
jgi:hypothetical protein